VKGRITLQRMAQILSENPARKFGLYPRKGVIKPGSDADMVIIDPDVEWEITVDKLHTKTGSTPYEGWKVKGRPVTSLVRGQILLKDGELHRQPGSGLFLRQ
jgi:dihydroorotase-like cyclic amidohydrolase